ncbi:MAG: hypothetical protein ACOYKD_05380 [Anaerolineaceae bacterium]|jgi:lysophospholipase L1-like esterase
MYTIVCFGDTNTWGYDEFTGDRLPFEKRWTGVLSIELGQNYRVIEEGLCGRTTVQDDPVETFKNGKTYLIPCLDSHKPINMLVLMLGQVNLKTRFSFTAQDIALGMEEIVKISLLSRCGIKNSPPKILLTSPVRVGPLKGTPMEAWFPVTTSESRSMELPRLYKNIADKYGIHFLDVSSVAETSFDGIHIANRSHKPFGEVLARLVREIVQ